jgi:phytoene synthase
MAKSGAIPDNLVKSYELCRNIHRAHGRTYYLACKLLPAPKRPHVHALYGFTRQADDIVDTTHSSTPATRVASLSRFRTRFFAALDAEGPPGNTLAVPGALAGGPAVIQAVINTIATFGLDRQDFEAFFTSMAMDLTVTRYQTYDELLEYMAGSAAAIGSMMLPILGATDPGAAREPARQLGLAFQLTNFIRDVGEDLERGRIYLPLEDLATHGVTPDELRAHTTTGPVRALIAHEVARAREHYTLAAEGIPLLHPTSQACIRAAYRAYGGILDEVVRANYDVFRDRAVVATSRKLAILAASLATPPGRKLRRVPGAPR